MPPEDAAPVEDTQAPPEDDAPSEDEGHAPESPDSPAVDYEKRYSDLRPEYDRTTQRLSQYEQFIGNLRNPETQAEALRALGFDLEDENAEPDDDYTDPEDRYEQRFAQIEQFLQQEAEAKAQADYEKLERQYLDEQVAEIAKSESVELTAEEREAVEGLADRMRDEDGIPDVKGAYELLSRAAEARQKRYVKSKKAPKVELGAAGTEKLDMADEDVRRTHLAQLIEAGRDD